MLRERLLGQNCGHPVWPLFALRRVEQRERVVPSGEENYTLITYDPQKKVYRQWYFSSRWPLGVFMVAALVGAAGFMTIVGRKRTNLTVDILTIAAWVVLGLIVAPIIGLALSPLAAIIVYAVMLAGIFVYVLRFGQFDVSFLQTVSWPITWSLVALFFAFCAHQLVLYQ